MQSLTIVLAYGVLATGSTAMSLFLGANSSRLNCAKSPNGPSYGDNVCRCIGIDNLKGYFVTQEKFHHVQRPAETGASCAAWEDGLHPDCKGAVKPGWCTQEWCYVDPCSCNLDVLPKKTTLGLTYQGMPAYWSYKTCGGTDLFSAEITGACQNQQSEDACAAQSECAWSGKQCAGKEVLQTCKEMVKKDETVYGQEDCRCIGVAGRGAGKSFMHINDKQMGKYPPNVGSTCEAWEDDTHPDCLKDGDKPSWCSAKWCFVDPCKCKTKTPPMAVMPANQYMRFQGKTAYWSYDACGSTNTWAESNKEMYCISQKSEASCAKLDKCSWNGKECLGKALVDTCAKQEATGVLGIEAPLNGSAALSIAPWRAFVLMFVAFAAAPMQ